MKNIDEAIKHAEEKAKELYCKADEDFFFDGDWGKKIHCTECAKDHEQLANWLKELKMHSWIPVTERLPVNTNPVNITWVNHQPESYYADIKDKPFTATGCFCDGKWYWYSSTCQDYLIYYRDCPFNAIDEGIEVLAWMPLPEPYKREETT